MIDPPCCIKKNEGKIVNSLRMLQFKSYEQEHTHHRVASRKNSCHFTKKTPTDMETLTHTETLMDTETWTDMESLTYLKP
jgi:hypothetical protein